MSLKRRVKLWRMSVNGPPIGDFRSVDGPSVKEELVLLASIKAPRDQSAYLTNHGVELRYAEYDSSRGRWERCLMSSPVFEMLSAFRNSGEFPYAFEASPSEGELEWLRAQANGATIRPVLPLHRYLVAARPEDLAAFEAAGEDDVE